MNETTPGRLRIPLLVDTNRIINIFFLEIFLPRITRRGDQYEDLSSKELTSGEKIYLVTILILKESSECDISPQDVFVRYNINYNTGKSWMLRYKRRNTLHDKQEIHML